MEMVYDKNKELKLSAFNALTSKSKEKSKITEFYIRIEELTSNISKLMRIKKNIKNIKEQISRNNKILKEVEEIYLKIEEKKELENSFNETSILWILERKKIKDNIDFMNKYIDNKKNKIIGICECTAFEDIKKYISKENKKLKDKIKNQKEKFQKIIDIEREYNPTIDKNINKKYIDSLTFDDLY